MNQLNVNYAFIDNLNDLLKSGNKVTVRGMETKELLFQHIKVLYPTQRCYVMPYRHDNVFAKIAETLWMLYGRDDIEWLSYYLPRAADFSDDGKVWRGAYGPRIRAWEGFDPHQPDILLSYDQLRYVVDLLNRDNQSRQAVINIWNPSIDEYPGKDIPCNNWLHFIIRQNPYTGKAALNLGIAQRSCDAMWGYSGIDTFAWSTMQQMMAYWTGVTVGQMSHTISSLHLYERHYKRAQEIFDNFKCSLYYYGIEAPKFTTDFSEFDTAIEVLFLLEELFRGKYINPADNPFVSCMAMMDEYFQACIWMLKAYCDYKRSGDLNLTAVSIRSMPICDFKLAAIEYFTRIDPGYLKLIPLTEIEIKTLQYAMGYDTANFTAV